MMRLDISHSFDKVPEAGAEVVEYALKLTATELWGQIAREAPVDHGRLAGSFLIEQQSPLRWMIYTLVEYALNVYHGTPPHTIFPVNAKALYWPGAPHPVKKVNHPGTAGNLFLDRAIENTATRVDDFAVIAINEVMGRYDL